MMKPLLALATLTSVASAEPIADERLHQLVHGNLIVTEDLAPAHVKLKPGEQEAYGFDRFMLADAPKLAHARTFTIVGAGSRCEVSSQKRVYFASSPDARARVAIELDMSACKDMQPLVVIDGKTEATAYALTGQAKADTWTTAWVERVTGETLDDKIGARRESLPGTNAFIVWANYKDGSHETLVGRSTRLLHRFSDLYVLGVLHDDGDRLLVNDSGVLETITI